MVRLLTVLRSGGEYRPEHVSAIADMVGPVECLTDMQIDDPRVKAIPLRHKWPGWWSKMELFRPDIAGEIFYLDLDTFVQPGAVHEMVSAARGKTTMLSDFYFPNRPASGIMFLTERDRATVWARWIKDPAAAMRVPAGRGTIGDQGFLGSVLSPQRWQDVAPGLIVSYKAHCKNGRPPGAKVVCFHGKPRPWALSEEEQEMLKC